MKQIIYLYFLNENVSNSNVGMVINKSIINNVEESGNEEI
jgi:hypothetical protein